MKTIRIQDSFEEAFSLIGSTVGHGESIESVYCELYNRMTSLWKNHTLLQIQFRTKTKDCNYRVIFFFVVEYTNKNKDGLFIKRDKAIERHYFFLNHSRWNYLGYDSTSFIKMGINSDTIWFQSGYED